MTTNDQIIQLLGSGYTVKEVAGKIGMKKFTVQNRIKIMKQRQNCRTVTHLVVKMLRLNVAIIDPLL